MICPECCKNPTLPGFSWCRGCISALAEDYHASDKKRWGEEARKEEMTACSALTQWLQLSQRGQRWHCWICGAKAFQIYGEGCAPYCSAEPDSLNAEWAWCFSPDCWTWAVPSAPTEAHCSRHGGRDYTPRTSR